MQNNSFDASKITADKKLVQQQRSKMGFIGNINKKTSRIYLLIFFVIIE